MKNRFSDLFTATGCDVVLLRNSAYTTDPNFAYASGLEPERFDSNLLLLEKGDSKPTLVLSSLEHLAPTESKNVTVIRVDSLKTFNATLRKKLRGKKIGLNFETYPHGRARMLSKNFKPKKIIDIGPAFGELRATKTKEEIRKIRTACAITTEILDHLPRLVKRFPFEDTLMRELQKQSRDHDCGLAYPPIVASGPHSGVPHHWPAHQKILRNQLLLIDFGVKYHGYCADLTRMYFSGRPSEQIEWEYWSVWNAKQKAFLQACEGVSAEALYNTANDFLKKSVRHEIPHALGHGLGLQVHDHPTRMATGERWKLRNGHCLTLEPAFYTNEYGIRIEDDFFIADGHAKWLSRAPSELPRI
jgi:Xaa-Pro dipeptidase